MSEYFPEPKSSYGRVKIILDLAKYAKKADLKNAASVDTSGLAKKIDLASFKSNVDNLDINKLKNVPSNLGNFKSNLVNLKSKLDILDVDNLVPVSVDLSKLSDVLKMMLFKKCINLCED